MMLSSCRWIHSFNLRGNINLLAAASGVWVHDTGSVNTWPHSWRVAAWSRPRRPEPVQGVSRAWIGDTSPAGFCCQCKQSEWTTPLHWSQTSCLAWQLAAGGGGVEGGCSNSWHQVLLWLAPSTLKLMFRSDTLTEPISQQPTQTQTRRVSPKQSGQAKAAVW